MRARLRGVLAVLAALVLASGLLSRSATALAYELENCSWAHDGPVTTVTYYNGLNPNSDLWQAAEDAVTN